MVYLSVLLLGIATGLFCHLFLHSRQRRLQRSNARARLIASPPAKTEESRFLRLPFIVNMHKKRQTERRAQHYEAELPRMLDILAMGMHAGLSFDTAFGLYVRRFESELAVLCSERFELWQRGLISRDEGLQQLASNINLPLFDSFCRTASRSIQYGVPMAPLIKEYASQARREYRNKQKELVLKAPIKMLLPTGTLILPAMMMLVIGPIILDVTERMV